MLARVIALSLHHAGLVVAICLLAIGATLATFPRMAVDVFPEKGFEKAGVRESVTGDAFDAGDSGRRICFVESSGTKS